MFSNWLRMSFYYFFEHCLDGFCEVIIQLTKHSVVHLRTAFMSYKVIYKATKKQLILGTKINWLIKTIMAWFKTYYFKTIKCHKGM